MTAKRLGKRLLKITGILLGILLVLLIGFHFWFKAHARQMMEELVETSSKGKLKLKIQKLHFNYFTKKMVLERAVFYNTDTASGTTGYRFSVEKIQLKAKAILPIVFRKQFLIDSIGLMNPIIEVTRLRASLKPDNKEKKDVSIPEEMGKVYRSIQDALKVLNVKKFQINGGIFVLINKTEPEDIPLTITNIDFSIENLMVSSGDSAGKKKILFSDNVVLSSSYQDILFPDQRHRLSFKNFRINLKSKLVEFDSCTIAATKGDSSKASFNVFFDVLQLTNIDFDTLYKSEVIKADSVYCVNPTFNLDVEVGKKKGVNKPGPKLENIIEQLTGDLQLGYVVVSNAAFNIRTVKNGVPSSFTFSNNNFEMQGLDVDQGAVKPIRVNSFAMAIRNYENFIKDSTYNIKFDSVVFKDDRITLSNFVFTKLEHGRILNSFSIPQFNLFGLSWDDLVFEKKLKADQAIMFNPSINYTATPKPGKQNIFESLGAMNEYMDLQELDIVDGDINIKLKNNLQVQLENATLSIQSQFLLESKKFAAIKNSLTRLKFDKGKIHAGNLDMELQDISYIGESGRFNAGFIGVTNKQKSTAIHLQGVTAEKMLVNELTGDVYAEGIRWKEGNIKLNGPAAKSNEGGSSFEIKDVRGGNTSLSGVFGKNAISTHLTSVAFDELEKKPGSKLKLAGLSLDGDQLRVKGNDLTLTVSGYHVMDNQNSSFRQVVYKTDNGKMDADISIPQLTLIPHIQELINGDIGIDAVKMVKPLIDLHLKSTGEKKKGGLPEMDISEVRLEQPVIRFSSSNDSGMTTLNWHGEKNISNFMQVKGLHTSPDNIAAGNLDFYLTDFVFNGLRGKTYNTGHGKISARLQNLQFELEANDLSGWKANIMNLDAGDLRLDSLGRSKGNFIMNSGTVTNLDISSSTILNLQKLAAANPSFRLKNFTGQYADSNTSWHWFNAGFNRNNNTFSLDSFSMDPAISKDSFIAKQDFQSDYIRIGSGKLEIGPLDIDKYIKNDILDIGTVFADGFRFLDYKDKRLPFHAGVTKPLPAELIKRIPQQLSVDMVRLDNATVEYTEVNEKTNVAATIPVTKMTIKLLNIKNYDIRPADSLTIHATGYLLDTTWIRLEVRQSYMDTLAGFVMTASMKPADLTLFNPLLVPMASVKLRSGFLDTLTMTAIGREYLSLGTMNMYYHDLKIDLLKAGEEKRRGFLTALINLILKNENDSRTSNVFFVRDRNRSAINYLIKIFMSGVTTSVGAKSNKKMIRQYKRKLKELNLPPIDID